MNRGDPTLALGTRACPLGCQGYRAPLGIEGFLDVCRKSEVIYASSRV